MRRRLPTALAAALCALVATVGAAGANPPEWWLHDIGADQAAAPGPGVPIVIVDGAVDSTQPMLDGRPNTTYLDPQDLAGPDDYHGTAVASLAAASGAAGFAGVYPQAALMLWDAGRGSVGIDPTSAAEGITTAARHCPAVINLSFGGIEPDPRVQDAILTAVHNGCLVVAAAGNGGEEGNPPTYPAAYPHVLTVGATTMEDAPAPFTSAGAWVDLAAPGADITAAVPLSHDPSGLSSGLPGTSFSAPLVSAAAAWVWTARPTLTAGQVAQLLRDSARPLAPQRFDDRTGYGIVNIPAALAAPTPPKDPEEPNDDIDEVNPGGLFPRGQPPLTTPARPSNRIAGTLLQSEDPRDLYRIWVPAHRAVRVAVSSGGAATAQIWGPATVSIDEPTPRRSADRKGSSIVGGATGAFAYAEVLLTGRSPSATYVLSVTAARR